MRTMKINKQKFYYGLYNPDPVEIQDADGFYTGEYRITYSDPVECKASISSSVGDTEIMLFGKDLQYDRTITFDKVRPEGIDEYTVFWIDKEPYDAQGNLQGYDYIVKKIATSINGFMVIAVCKAEVST